MSSRIPSQAPLVARRPLAVRPQAASPAGDFQNAESRLKDTRDLGRAEKELATMRQALAAASPAEQPELQARFTAAEGRVAVLRVLAKPPAAPKSQVLRNPDGAAQIAAKGGGGGIMAWLGGLMPGARGPQEPAWTGLSAEAKAGAKAAWAAMGPSGQTALVSLAGKRLPAQAWVALGELAKAPLAQGLDRQQLLNEVAVQMDDPATVTQGTKAVCSAAAVQMRLVASSPAIYLGLVKGLASPQGSVRLAGGATLRRESDWNSADGGRALPDRLLQPALMELGNGERDYDNRRDADLLPDGRSLPPGLDGDALARVLAQVSGQSSYRALTPGYTPQLPAAEADAYDSLLASPEDYLAFLATPSAASASAQNAMLEALQAELKLGRPAVAIIVARMEGSRLGHHAVVVQGIAGGTVRFLNPWGQEESLPVAEFRRALLAATTT